MLHRNEKPALAARSAPAWVDYRFRLEDPRVLFSVVAATYVMAVPPAFGWSTVALAACVKLVQRVGFIDV